MGQFFLVTYNFHLKTSKNLNKKSTVGYYYAGTGNISKGAKNPPKICQCTENWVKHGRTPFSPK